MTFILWYNFAWFPSSNILLDKFCMISLFKHTRIYGQILHDFPLQTYLWTNFVLFIHIYNDAETFNVIFKLQNGSWEEKIHNCHLSTSTEKSIVTFDTEILIKNNKKVSTKQRIEQSCGSQVTRYRLFFWPEQPF